MINFFATNSLCLPVTLAETLYVISDIRMYVYLTVALEILYFRNTIFSFTCFYVLFYHSALLIHVFDSPFHISPYGLDLYGLDLFLHADVI